MSLRRVLVWGVLRGEHVDSSPARGRLALDAAKSCCAATAPAVEACVVAVRCRVSRRTDHGRRESLLVESLACNNKKTHKSLPSASDWVLDTLWSPLSRSFGHQKRHAALPTHTTK